MAAGAHHKRHRPHLLLKQAGLLETGADGGVVSWEAYAQSCGISAQVFVKDRKNDTKVWEILDGLLEQGYVQNVFTSREIEETHHLTGAFEFVLEAADGYAFSNRTNGALIIPTDASDYKFSVSTHGHLPERGEKPCFIMHGKGIEPDQIIGARLVDEAPTFLQILNIHTQELDGKSLL